MRKWTKAASLIFLAAASVYPGQVIGANSAKPVNSNTNGSGKSTDIKLLDDKVDPFADPAVAQPTSTATATGTTAATTQPADTVSAPEKVESASSQSHVAGGSAAPLQFNSDGTFSLSISSGADLVEQLRVIGYQAQRSILPSKDVRGTLPAMDLYNVTVKEALDAILQVNGYGYKEQGNFIFVYSQKEMQEMEKANRVMQTEVFRLYYTPAANAVTMIKPVLSGEAQVSVSTPAVAGIESGTTDVGGNSHATEDVIVVSDYQDNLDRARRLIKEIDRRPQQILIEATILRAALTEDNQLGVDFNVVGGVDFSSITHSNGQITNANLPEGADALPANKRHSSVGTGNSFTSAIPGGFRVGVMTDNFSAFLAALETTTDTTVLANPKVLALNKQKGEVIVGRKDGYLTTTVTDTTSTQSVEFLDTGTRLIFRPYIGDDGYIRMELHPEDSSGGLTGSNLPFKTTTEVTSNIMVKDGHTVLIGGLFREATDSGRSQIPIFGDLPLVGALFRNQHDTTKREEIIILLTPHIVKDDTAYSAESEELLHDAERLRVGVRKGLMPWGRERLAEWWYDHAVREMNKPHPNRHSAIWSLNAATNLNPKYLEAIKMKEDLSGKVVTQSDNSSVRTFVAREVLRERMMPATPTTAPTADAEQTKPVIPTTKPMQAITMPAAAEAPVMTPATRPTDVQAVAPATQPTELVVEAPEATPTTQPTTIVEVVAEPQQAEPSTPTAEAPTTQPVVSGSQSFQTFTVPGNAASNATSTTQPTETGTKMTITELPLDEAADGDNK